jgi:Protein of unknown function (DUF3108)
MRSSGERDQTRALGGGGERDAHLMTARIAKASERATRPWTPLYALAPVGMALWSAACGGPPAAPAARATPASSTSPTPNAEERAQATLIRLEPTKPFFVPGESMSFELSYGGILTGRAVLAAGEPGEIAGRSVLIVRSQFETAGAAKLVTAVRDHVDTQIDWNTGAPIEHRGQALGSGKPATALIRFEGQRTLVHYQREGKRALEFEVKLPPGEIMHDTHSILGALRAWEPEPDAVVYFYSASGRRVWRTEMAFHGSKTVRTAMGLRAALHFVGSSARLNHRSLDVDPARSPRRIELWISDDAQRMPLRVVAHTEYGAFQAELVSYQSPGQPVSLN